MKISKPKIIIIIFALILAIIIAVFLIYTVHNDPFNPSSPNYYYKDRTIYPLEKININDNSEYLLLKWQHSPEEKFEVVSDKEMIKANKSSFFLENDGSIYGTTPDGAIELYENGKSIVLEAFDNNLTKKIEYGTLKFKEVNELQYRLLLGAVVVKQDSYYTIICDKRDEDYYYFFAHGNDLDSLDTVYLLDSNSDLEKLPVPQEVSGDSIDFIKRTGEGTETYWRLNLVDFSISDD